eukprot:TRINITY_DN4173_c0_g1_i7.p1 TRINITY_DN4173_c0_g1~~TRINITY_DN4173_c0_g1_i7.p1  ORF type:complete len:166 (-),score=27.00 TRINITY_DN4173_c0_g1_i7:219-716(-)
MKEYGITGYNTLPATLYSLFLAFVGDFDNSVFSTITNNTLQVYLEILQLVYVMLSLVVLTNLLIAMMTTTYELVREEVDKEFQFLKIEACWMNYRQSAILPPPFTSLAHAIYIGIKIIDFIWSTIWRTSTDLRNSQTMRRSQLMPTQMNRKVASRKKTTGFVLSA